MILITKQKPLIRPKTSFLQTWFVKQLKKQIDLLSDKEILDFGGGTGLLTLPLAKQAKSVTLVDILGENAGASPFESRATRNQEYPVFGAGFTGESLGTAI